MLCAKNVSRAANPLSYDWFDMVTCMNGKDGIPGVTYNNPDAIPEDAQRCAKQAGVDWGAVQKCSEGEQGRQLLHDSHFQTMDLFAQHGGYNPPGAFYYLLLWSA